MEKRAPQRASVKKSPVDRVRASTPPDLLHEIDRRIEETVRLYANQPKEVISRRIEQIDREWDIERVLEANASTLALTGLLLSFTGGKKWLLLSGGVLSFLLQHAIQGWCPPIPFLRKMGVRTQSEIDREKFALKFLRGDFAQIPHDKKSNGNRVEELLGAVRA